MITEEEKQDRQKHWDYVVASMELSDCSSIHVFDPLMQEYINGDITEEEKDKRWFEIGKEMMNGQEIF